MEIIKSMKRPREEREKRENGYISALAPALWNSLPGDIRILQDLSQLHRARKTELFQQAYGQDSNGHQYTWP